MKNLIILLLISLLTACSDDSSSSGKSSSNNNNNTPIIDTYADLVALCTKTIDNTVAAAQRFAGMVAGDILCLEDGTYGEGLNVPSGITVVAETLTGAVFTGGDNPSSEILLMAGDSSTVVGIKVTRPDSSTSDACKIGGTNNSMIYSTCSHGGTYKHSLPLSLSGSGHLVENSWFYGEGRYVVMCFKGDNMTFRRNIARWDSTEPNNASEPNATFSNYNCSDNLWENNISLDYAVPDTPMLYGGDFYSPHNEAVYPTGNINNRYYGNMVVNHARGTSNRRGFRFDSSAPLTTIMTNNEVKDFYVQGSGVGFTVRPNYELMIENCSMIDVDNGAGDTSTAASALPVDCGSGADIDFRYEDGVKTNESLWPYDYEDHIKADMCATGERQSDWCSYTNTLFDYVLGN